MEREDSFFYYNPHLRGKKYKDIKKIDQYDEHNYTQLITAVENKDIALVKKVLNQGADPNIVAGNGMTAVIQAIISDQYEILTLLVKRGAVPTDKAISAAKSYQRENYKYLELVERYYRPPKKEKPDPRLVGRAEKHISVISEDEGLELKKIIEWESKNKTNHPSLTAAVMFDRPIEILTNLLDEGSKINEDDPLLGTPLSQAIFQGRDIDYVKFLLEYGANPNQVSKRYKRWPLLEAVKANNLELVKLLFEFLAKIWVPEAKSLEHPFSYALKYGSFNMTKFLIEQGADPKKKVKNADGEEYWPFLLAAGFGKATPELIDLLIDSGANPKVTDDKGCNAFALLDWTDENIPGAIRLLELGVSPKNSCVFEIHKSSPYHWAVREESKELLLALAKTRLSPNVFDEEASSPLYLAVIFDRPWFVKALIDAGANVNKSVVAPGVIFADFRGVRKAAEDLLAEAIIHTDNKEIVETLLDAGVKINAVTNSPDKLTALHVAVEENKPELAELILKRRSVNKEAKDIYGYTPLHLAVHAENPKFVKLLVDAGAKITAKDKEGQTPVDLARGVKNEKELMEALGL
jgi:ankyrin repeat protein